MPKIGLTMEGGEIVAWLREVGEPVVEGDPLLEFSTEKVTTEIEAPTTGILSAQLVRPGDLVPVGAAVAVIERSAG
jgi:pyruvate/2-oxoglutarate dehydrogenase complex dihydrolipoamide acyltransferase (E2) component